MTDERDPTREELVDAMNETPLKTPDVVADLGARLHQQVDDWQRAFSTFAQAVHEKHSDGSCRVWQMCQDPMCQLAREIVTDTQFRMLGVPVEVDKTYGRP